MSVFTDLDAHLFAEGTHARLFDVLGGKLKAGGGAQFSVWAPNAREVSVIGDFNGWNREADRLQPDRCGVWSGNVVHAARGDRYKFHILSKQDGYRVDKADPFGVRHEEPPATASILWDLDFEWTDQQWMTSEHRGNAANAPQATYEMHLGSWQRVPEQDHRMLAYRELAERLPEYLVDMGYTHVEFLPVMEHPFFGSWGYQTTGYFAPTSRLGTPQDFMYLIDRLHRAGISVWLDWVPSHFPGDAHGLSYFDGTHLFEHADPRQGFHPEWQSCIFNLGRHEVRAFLISSALYWLDYFHADGIRVDAVASMLYLDYARPSGMWVPNVHGGRENLEAVGFLRTLNSTVANFDSRLSVIAEESTAWPGVTRPPTEQGLGFCMKWNMGWMHDTLNYLSTDPIHRRHDHDQLTFSMVYAYNERFVLPLSHDEVVHGKGSLLNKMPGDDWQRRANLRLLFGYMWAHPGKKLLFMGADIGQRREWNHDSSIDWHLLNEADHKGIHRWVRALNELYRTEAALHALDFDPEGFHWIVSDDRENSVLAFLRRGLAPAADLLVICNFTPVPRHNYGVGAPSSGRWREVLNGDAEEFGGSGLVQADGYSTSPLPSHGYYQSLYVTVPPLAVIFLKREENES